MRNTNYTSKKKKHFFSNLRMPTKLAILLMILSLAMVKSVLSQSKPSLILASPSFTKGYLVLQKTDERIDHFVITMYQTSYSPTGSLVRVPVSKVELWDVNYWEVPSEFTNLETTSYSIEVFGVGPDGIVYDSEEQPMSFCDNCDDSMVRTYFCESYTASFKLTIAHPGGDVNYTVEDGTGMMWFSDQDFQAIAGGGIIGYDGTVFSNPDQFEDFNGQSDVPNNPSQPGGVLHRRMDGSFIPDAFPFVHGIPKKKHLWCEDQEQVQGHVELASLPYELEAAAHAVSTSSSWECEPLVCNEMYTINWPTTGEGETDVVDYLWEWVIKEWQQEMKEGTQQDNDLDGDKDFWDSFIHLLGAFSEDGREQRLKYQKSDLVDANGTPTPPTFTLSEGMYEIVFTVSSGQLFRFFLPVEEKLVSNFSLSSYASLLPYPVPVVQNSFEMNIQSAANLEFQAEVLDLSGNKYFENKYIVKAGHNENHGVKLPSHTPNGLLVVRLLFKDGSQKSVTITKNS
jgi:hypothetical protein